MAEQYKCGVRCTKCNKYYVDNNMLSFTRLCYNIIVFLSIDQQLCNGIIIYCVFALNILLTHLFGTQYKAQYSSYTRMLVLCYRVDTMLVPCWYTVQSTPASRGLITMEVIAPDHSAYKLSLLIHTMIVCQLILKPRSA